MSRKSKSTRVHCLTLMHCLPLIFEAVYLPSRSLLAEGGVERLVYIANSKGKYSPKVVKFASSVRI